MSVANGNIITRTASTGQTYLYRQPPALPALPPMPYKVFLPLVMQTGESYGAPPPATLHQPFAVISTTAGFRAGYDANGNPSTSLRASMLTRVEVSGTQRITYTQQWNVENQLSVVTNTVNSAVTRFAYDADGKRVAQTLPNGSRTVYVNSLEVSITGTQRITKTYYTAGAQMVAMRVVSSTGNVLYFIHGDHLGSTSLVTCGSTGGCNGIPYQGVVAQQLYAPYGVPRWISGTLPTDVGFTGQRVDTTGLMFYNARYYSAGLGRFLSADTIVPGAGNPQSLNRYTYTQNNPVKFTDPTGHHEECSYGEGCGQEGMWSPPPPPPTPPLPTQESDDPLARLYGNADYYGATLNINPGYPVMLIGAGVSYISPEVGVPTALVGAALTESSISVGASVEWDRYGDVSVSIPNLAFGKTLGGAPISGDFFAGRILTGRDKPATQEETSGFISGPSSSVSGGVAQLAVGGTVSWTSTNKIGVERHIMWPPQIGVMLFSWGFLLPVKNK